MSTRFMYQEPPELTQCMYLACVGRFTPPWFWIRAYMTCGPTQALAVIPDDAPPMVVTDCARAPVRHAGGWPGAAGVPNCPGAANDRRSVTFCRCFWYVCPIAITAAGAASAARACMAFRSAGSSSGVMATRSPPYARYMKAEVVPRVLEGRVLTGGVAMVVARSHDLVRVVLTVMAGHPAAALTEGQSAVVEFPAPVPVTEGERVAIILRWASGSEEYSGAVWIPASTVLRRAHIQR